MPLPLFGSKTSASPKAVIGIAAGKGGVGKSTLTVNLALSLKLAGKSVGILDADVYGPSIRTMLKEERLPKQKGDRFVPALACGIKIMSLAYFNQIDSSSSFAVRAPIANKMIQQFIHQVEWGDLDVLLIDFPPGTGDVQLTIAQQSFLTGAVVVTTAQKVALQDVRKAIDFFRKVNIPLLGIVENMSAFVLPGNGGSISPFGKGGGELLSKETGAPFLGEIPLDPLICQTGDEGISLFELPNANELICVKAFKAIGQKILNLLNTHERVEIINVSGENSLSLNISWSNGTIQEMNAAELQKNCPCAGCKNGDYSHNMQVKIVKIHKVGRYALRFEFSSGCSQGIYSFDALRTP